MEDSKILEVLSKDHNQGIILLLDKYGKPIFKFIKTKFPNLGTNGWKEIHQEVFLIFWLNFKDGKYSEAGKLFAYLCTIAANTGMSYLRKEVKTTSIDDDFWLNLQTEDAQELDFNEILKNEAMNALIKCIESIKLQSIDLFKLHHLEGIKIVDLAKQNGINDNALRQRFNEIKIRIKRCMGKKFQLLSF